MGGTYRWYGPGKSLSVDKGSSRFFFVFTSSRLFGDSILANPFVRSVDAGEKHPKVCRYHCIITCQRDQSPYCIADALLLSLSGDASDGLVFAGANAWKVSELVSVPQLMATLDQEIAHAQKESVPASERI